MMSGGDALIEFRTAYLRAIALVWRLGVNDASVKSLLEPSTNALEVMKDLFGCDVPWNLWVRLTWEADESKRPQWRPRLAGGWVGGEAHHRIIVYVPSHECLPSPDVYSDALAAHYTVSPTPFGKKSSSTHQGYDIRLGSIATFEEFGGVFLRMLGLLWRSSTEADLAEIPLGLFGPKPDELFQRWFGYRWPWHMSLSFVKCLPTAQSDGQGGFVPYCMQWTTGQQESSAGAGWKYATVDEQGNVSAFKIGLPPNELELSIPHYPVREDDRTQRDEEIEPVALGAYNQTGEGYPCSCCGCC